ncbi:putative type I restriction enzymeP M protein [termite gut metagenome]|uniref:Putative type I restriction enzymeP M protein n=1 Tax=termite gut metagenome TaxID=433724 RepID=A0A5J4QB82_9ZZZZ
MIIEIQIKGNKIFAPLKNEWLKNTAEEKLKQELICRLVNAYGYLLNQLGQDVEIKKNHKADIAIWCSEQEKLKNSVPAIIITVECKAEHIKIKESDYSIARDFASTINTSFFIAVNLKETKIFHIQRDNAPKKIEQVSDIPKAEILSDDKKIEKYIKDNKSFSREEFSKLLTRCHNIIRNNDKLSPEAAFDEISKILFMKIMYERDAKGEMIFSKEKFHADEKIYEKVIRPQLRKNASYFDQDYMQYLFDETKREFEKDEIFEPKDQIKIKRNSFEMIVEELETFNLSDIADDVKGIAFEHFLGKTFRGELGQFFTPRTIVDFMVNILDPQEGELICDPCCGSGGFLITAFEYMRNKIDEDIRNQIKSIKKQNEQKNIDLIIHAVNSINEEFNINTKPLSDKLR